MREPLKGLLALTSGQVAQNLLEHVYFIRILVHLQVGKLILSNQETRYWRCCPLFSRLLRKKRKKRKGIGM
jgi:hypothetical protein